MSKKPKYGYGGSPEFKPLSPLAYFGYSLLFSIPVIGLICNLVFCFADGNRNRKNFARSIWVGALVVLIITIAAVFIIKSAVSPETQERFMQLFGEGLEKVKETM
ncbi:MAG: hypothetical protein KBT46_01300 [Ruminococcus sp.]|nr:hypothetical protein [Candidatus Copronaster equi]